MKILHINDYLLPRGGIEVYLLELLHLLEGRGVECSVIYGRGETERVGAIQIPGISDPASPIRTALEEQLRAIRPDIVHVHGITNTEVLRTCLDHGKTVMTGHDYRYVCPASNLYYRNSMRICKRKAGWSCLAVTAFQRCMSPRPRPGLDYLQRVLFVQRNHHRFAHLVTPSRYTAARYIQAGFAPDRVTPIPYFCPVSVADAPRPLPEKPVVTFLGRSPPYKGGSVFIRMLGLLPADVTGWMVGGFSDSERRVILDSARRAGCEDRIQFMPWTSRDAVGEIYRQSSVVLFPSLCAETLGIVGLESSAHGVPVVASDIGAVDDWLEKGRSGYVFPPGDARAAAEHVRGLIEDRVKNQAFGLRALQIVREKFLPEKHLEDLLAVYEKVRRAPAPV